MKEIHALSKQKIKMSENEVKILKKMHHTNVIKYYGYDTIKNKDGERILYIFMEYAN